VATLPTVRSSLPDEALRIMAMAEKPDEWAARSQLERRS
jgi:hypothetical protein